MKLRLYLILDDSVKRVGVNLTRTFKELASQTVPALTVYFSEVDGMKSIIRLQLHTLTFDSEGRHIISEVEARHAAIAIERAIFGGVDGVAYFSDYQKVRLSEKQKRLLGQKLEKDFGPAWKNFNPALKTLFWSRGDTHIWSRE